MNSRLALYLSALTPCLMLSACDWVDSTGDQLGNVAVTEVLLDNAAVGDAIMLNELSEVYLTASRESASTGDQIFTWSDEAQEQGNLDSCRSLPDFNTELAADTLSEACVDSAQCTLSFLPVEAEEGSAEFLLNVPALNAPVGVRHDLSVQNAAGEVNSRSFYFCLIAINEAPIAINDTFATSEGLRRMFGTPGAGLLANDSDDFDDVSNTTYEILPEAAEDPKTAAFFELNTDGTFIYESSLTGISVDQLDSFVYQLSDGVHVSEATATVRVAAENEEPTIVEEIPELTATVGMLLRENLAQYFSDPEEADLTFKFDDSTPLPMEGTLGLSLDGLLSGIPADADIGSHVLTLIVSDGGRTVEATLTLLVEAAEVENSEPEFVSLSPRSQFVRLGNSITPIIPEFIDPDGDTLSYSMYGTVQLPDGVEIDEASGVISGTPTSEINVRRLVVEATDPLGESAISYTFSLRVQ